MQTATEQLRRQDMRMYRAQSLMHAVLQRIDPYLDPELGNHARRDVYEALLKLFHDEGVDVITDAQRADAGLPPRGPDGWTIEEMMAIEKRRLDILTAPIYAAFPKEALEGK
jgi:hypothetical protein